MSLFESASLVVTPNGTKASKLYAIKPTDGSGDLSVTRATTATRVNSSGLISSVASNVPRLDYTNSTCPSILVEPQRTNLVLRSQEFDNAAWTKTILNGTLTVTENYGISPDGTQNAERFQMTITTGYSDVIQPIVTTSSIAYTYSIYLKSLSGTPTICFLNDGVSGNKLVTLTNEWKRYSFTINSSGALIYPRLLLENGLTSNSADILVYGAQLEVGGYATSYIPTTSASVTRNADVISKTGISSLIGQTEGTIYTEIELTNFDTVDQLILQLSENSSNRFGLSIYRAGLINRAQFYQIFGGNVEVNINTLVSAGVFKLAGAYKNNEYVFYVNGQQIGIDTSASVPNTSKLELGGTTSAQSLFGNKIKSAILFKTRLSNSELAQLTTI